MNVNDINDIQSIERFSHSVVTHQLHLLQLHPLLAYFSIGCICQRSFFFSFHRRIISMRYTQVAAIFFSHNCQLRSHSYSILYKQWVEHCQNLALKARVLPSDYHWHVVINLKSVSVLFLTCNCDVTCKAISFPFLWSQWFVWIARLQLRLPLTAI